MTRSFGDTHWTGMGHASMPDLYGNPYPGDMDRHARRLENAASQRSYVTRVRHEAAVSRFRS